MFVLASGIAALACSSDSGNSGGAGGLAEDAGSDQGGASGGGSPDAGSGTGGAGGAGGSGDPACAQATARGFFPDCSLCGMDCDTIDDGSGTYKACGCSGGCPCGLRCGSYEIAPNVVVSDICVR
jgi:hypothetical protein